SSTVPLSPEVVERPTVRLAVASAPLIVPAIWRVAPWVTLTCDAAARVTGPVQVLLPALCRPDRLPPPVPERVRDSAAKLRPPCNWSTPERDTGGPEAVPGAPSELVLLAVRMPALTKVAPV